MNVIVWNEILAEKLGTTSHEVLVSESVCAALAAGTALYFTIKGLTKLWDMWQMHKRARLSKDVCEIIEDHVVDAFSQAIENKWISLDEARELYARFARLGFWGLHPRKFTPRKTEEELAALKSMLNARKAAREASKKQSTSSVVDKLLDGLDAELAV